MKNYEELVKSSEYEYPMNKKQQTMKLTKLEVIKK